MKKLLIANRGEIAVRVIRAAQEMGIRTVAVYSEADATARHVALADESAPLTSYLDIPQLIGSAEALGADALHPGYGFLSERPELSEACRAAGITFVGPSPEAMRKLGAKIDAKQLAVRVGVPITPGYFEPGATQADLARAADDLGYPVMLKASAGGGGRGMRVVARREDFSSEFEIASAEALNAFGDGAMMVEKLVVRPRHVEAQVLADQHGTVAVLFERECSIQRRRQKLIEEAPSPLMTPDLWSSMRRAAIALVREAGYVGAGTVEFMVDPADLSFSFLEINARLQVEHPVTEMITGLDLVQWQLRIADGERLDLSAELLDGDRRAISRHAIEARIVAEDPARGFLPSAGRILAWAAPHRPGVRVDTGYGPDAEISRHYDSLVAKVIACGETRREAIRRLRAALMDFHILGVKTNIGYLIEVLDHPQFLGGDYDTDFLAREFKEWAPGGDIPAELPKIAARASTTRSAAPSGAPRDPAWSNLDGFRVAKTGR